MRYWSVVEKKYKKIRRITSAQIFHHTGSHVVGKYCLEDTLRRFQIKEDEMKAKKSSCDAMYMKNAQWWMLYFTR